MSTNQSPSAYDVVVLGAGISGLLAARSLTSAGLRLVVLDKGRGVGGRIATRRIEQAVFDHGAQYFTARDPAFVAQVREWEQSGIITPWSTGFSLSSGGFKDDGEPRYRGVGGMTALAKHLALGLDVRLSHKASRLETADDGWKITLENGGSIFARSLVLTPPVPQSLALLDAGAVSLPAPTRRALNEIRYAPSLALMVRLPSPSLVPKPGGLWSNGEPYSWIADNSQKGITNTPGSITIHAGPDYSQRHWTTPEPEVTSDLLAAAAPWLGHKPIETQLHRWRYSIPISTHPDRCVVVPGPAPLVFAGDAFGGPRVEGAALSGLAASQALLGILNHA